MAEYNFKEALERINTRRAFVVGEKERDGETPVDGLSPINVKKTNINNIFLKEKENTI